MKRKIFEIPAEYTFYGTFNVLAEDIDEAKSIVDNSCFMHFGSIEEQAGTDEEGRGIVQDWDFNTKCEPTINPTMQIHLDMFGRNMRITLKKRGKDIKYNEMNETDKLILMDMVKGFADFLERFYLNPADKKKND